MKPSNNITQQKTPLLSERSGEASGSPSIGIFGGSVNPIHKVNQQLLADHLRLELVRKAIAHNPQFKALDYEFQLPKPSYTWNTLQHLRHDYPTYRFTLLVGGDNWAAFDRWNHAEDILANYKIVVYPRLGQEIDKTILPANVSLLQTPLINVSSTDIRHRVEQREDISRLVPADIENEIQRLYSAITPIGKK